MISAPSAGGCFRKGPLPWRLRPRPRSCLVSPPASGGGETEKGRHLLVERYRDGVTKRYTLDDNSKLHVSLEKHESLVNTTENENPNPMLPRAIRDFVLPARFPDDYLDYMLLQLPTNVTGWICHVLVTSSLLKIGIGVGSFTGTSAAASAAAIRWVSQWFYDTSTGAATGAARCGFFVGGAQIARGVGYPGIRWTRRFTWFGPPERNTLCPQGDVLEHFLMMTQRNGGCMQTSLGVLEASLSLLLRSIQVIFSHLHHWGIWQSCIANHCPRHFKQAIGRGFRDPSFRVIQNHFAESGNLGEVAAKEEVWEVGAQLLGLSIGVLIMDTTGVKSSYETLMLTWLSVRLLHLWLRYQSLTVLKFCTINLKRGRILVSSHVEQHTVPGYVACNKEENILTWERFMRPQISFGVTMERMLGGEESSDMVNRLLKLYRNEKYILFVEQFGLSEPTFLVAFKESATSISVLRSLWQAHWLHKNLLMRSEVFLWLEESLHSLEHGFTDFLMQMEESGWDQTQLILKVPKEPVVVSEHLRLM